MKTYGSDPKAVAWRDRERQLRRFQIFSGLFETVSVDSEFSVNDLGCGYGAMFQAYRDLSAFRTARYYGYDICTGMLQEARANISDPRATWIHSHEATCVGVDSRRTRRSTSGRGRVSTFSPRPTTRRHGVPA